MQKNKKEICRCPLESCEWEGTYDAYRHHKRYKHQELIKKNTSPKQHYCVCLKAFHHVQSLNRHAKDCVIMSQAVVKQQISNGECLIKKSDNLELINSYYLVGNVMNFDLWNHLAQWQFERSGGRLFDVLHLDCPWTDTGIKLKYSTMSIEELSKLPLHKVQKVGWLFMWVTNRKVKEGLDLMSKWGYTYVTTVGWYKANEGETASGLGYWTQNVHEDCLMGYIGKPAALRHITKRARMRNAIYEKRPKPQSRKPEKIYDEIEQHVPGGYKLEVFGRKHNQHSGWVTFGLEAN